jgi:hypothetical protein
MTHVMRIRTKSSWKRRFVRKTKRDVALYLSAQTGMGPTGITTRKRGYVVRKTKSEPWILFYKN